MRMSQQLPIVFIHWATNTFDSLDVPRKILAVKTLHVGKHVKLAELII